MNAMSGPKSSRYTLTAAQQRAIEEQRRIEQERKENCIWVKNTLGQIQKENSTFVREQAVAKELTAKTGNDHGLQRLIQEIQETVKSTVVLAQNVESKDADHVKIVYTQIKQRQAEIALLQQKIRQAAQDNDEALGCYFGASIVDAFSAKNDVSLAPVEKIVDSSENLKAKICAELTKVLDAQPKISDDLFARGEQAKSALEKLQDEEHLKNFAAITVMPLLADCQKKIVAYEMLFEVYSQTRACYEALCLSAEVEPKETRCCQTGLEMLQREIERLQQQLAEDDERAYISQSIDEVMAEMGYDVIGQRQVRKKNGRHFTNELYAYEDGTAVNVTYADDGKITMELGGLDTDDRLPDAAEAKQLCESMESFCDDFSEIEKRLEAKGVVLKSRIALLPPSEDYAQIINVSDYETTAPIDTFKANNRRSGIGQGKERYLKE